MKSFLFSRGHRNKKSSHQPPIIPTPPPSRHGGFSAGALVCHSCKLTIDRSDRHIYIQQQHQRRYHIKCFVCSHCHAQINPQHEEFCYSKTFPNRNTNTKLGVATGVSETNHSKADNKTENDVNNSCTNDQHGHGHDALGEHKLQPDDAGGGGDNSENSFVPAHAEDDDDEHLFHRACSAHRFGWLCVVCEKPLPMVTTRISIDEAADHDVATSNMSSSEATISTTSGNRNDALDGSIVANFPNLGLTRTRRPRTATTTTVQFLKHPFFSHERICPHHHVGTPPMLQQHHKLQEHVVLDYSYHSRGEDSCGEATNTTTVCDERRTAIRQCAGCHRFEPSLTSQQAKYFVDVGDPNSGQCLCLACCKTVVTSSEDVIPLWDRVIDFFDGPLGLLTSEYYRTNTGRIFGGVTRQDLENIPIMMVGMEALNDNMREQRNDHYGSNHIITQGMCLSEHDSIAKHRQDGDDPPQQEVLSTGSGGVVVTAILCLIGLPADLTASILAHEATHAYIQLHPNFSHSKPLPPIVEEGLAQLVAHLFLSEEGIYHTSTTKKIEASRCEIGIIDIDRGGGTEVDSIPSDEELRQYFRFCIETDNGMYGEGFRMAARAYASMGIHELLYYVALHHCFPPVG